MLNERGQLPDARRFLQRVAVRGVAPEARAEASHNNCLYVYVCLYVFLCEFFGACCVVRA